MPRAKKAMRKIPQFESEEQEREFWASHDSTDHINWQQARQVKLSNLRPTTRTILIRLPESMIERLKVMADKRDVCRAFRRSVP